MEHGAKNIYYVLLITFSVVPNCLVIVAFLNSRAIMTFKDTFLVSLALCDLLRSLFGYIPEILLATSTEEEVQIIVRRFTCFATTFMAFASIAHVIFLAGERALALRYPYFSEKMAADRRTRPICLAAIWMYGLFWALMPILGWSSYNPNLNHIKCSINWSDQSRTGKSYVMLLFVFCYALPMISIAGSFALVRRELHNMTKRARVMFGVSHQAAENLRIVETKHAILVSIMAAMFLLAWTPYAVVSFLSALDIKVSIRLSDISAFLGKCSATFNPFIYALCYPNYRSAVGNLRAYLPCARPPSSNV